MVLDVGAQGQEALVAVGEDPLRFREFEAIGLDGQFSLGEGGFEVRNLFAQRREAQLRGFVVLDARTPLFGGDRELQYPQGLAKPLVARGLLGLPVDRIDLPANLGEHVGDPEQILLRRPDFRFGLAAPGLVLADASRLFDQGPSLFGLRGDDLGDPPLLDDRVALGADAGIPKKVVHIAHPARRAIDEVLGLAGPVEAPGDLDFGVGRKRGRPVPTGVVEGEDHLGHSHGAAPLGSLEDHVVHALAAQAAGRLLAHHPAHGVDDVRFAAAVGAHHRGHAGLEGQRGLVHERFEAVKF